MVRLITINLGNFDRETEIHRDGQVRVSPRNAEIIVDIVRELRGTGVNNHRPTIRATIAIARILVHRQAHARLWTIRCSNGSAMTFSPPRRPKSRARGSH